MQFFVSVANMGLIPDAKQGEMTALTKKKKKSMTAELPVFSCQLLNFKAKADQKHLPSKNVVLNQGWNTVNMQSVWVTLL